MSFYFRDRPKFSDRLRGKSGDELLQEIKQQFDEDSKSFFEPTNRPGRDSFERHSAFSRDLAERRNNNEKILNKFLKFIFMIKV